MGPEGYNAFANNYMIGLSFDTSFRLNYDNMSFEENLSELEKKISKLRRIENMFTSEIYDSKTHTWKKVDTWHA